MKEEASEPKPYFPSVYLSDLPGLKDCPEEFYLKCRRTSITNRETKNSQGEKETTSIEAECLEMVIEMEEPKTKSWMDNIDDIEVGEDKD